MTENSVTDRTRPFRDATTSPTKSEASIEMPGPHPFACRQGLDDRPQEFVRRQAVRNKNLPEVIPAAKHSAGEATNRRTAREQPRLPELM